MEVIAHNKYDPTSETMERGLQVFQYRVQISLTKGSSENEYEDFQPENHVPKMESGALFP